MNGERLGEVIYREITTDDYPIDGDKILTLYDNATEHEQQLLDNLLIIVCGWSLETLLRM